MDEEEDRAELMNMFRNYIDDNPALKSVLEKETEHLIIDFIDLIHNKPKLGEHIIEYTDDAILLCKDVMREYNELDLEIRFENFESISTNIIPIREVRSKHIGRMFSVKGIIKQISDVRPIIKKIRCVCPACETERAIFPKDNIIDLKTRCGCGFKGKFKEIGREYIDMQRMILEEDIDILEGNQQPKRINVLLTKELTKTKFDVLTTPGTKVFITAVVREIPKRLENKQLAEREFLLEANFISPIEGTYESLVITKEDEERIKELSKDPDLMQKLVDSFAMDIYGYKEVKESIILCMFGGTPKFVGKDQLKRRGDFHLILIGEPGIGKSKLVKNTKDFAPKYRYNSAARGTGTGYTAAVVKDEFMGTWALEAGSLVLASGGIAVIDEFEKAKEEDLGKLHEILSEGSITVDKANIHCCYSEDTEVLTDKGWNKYNEITPYMKVVQYNNKEDCFSFVKHQGIFVYDYVGEMINFKTRSMDILVTPNHRMLVSAFFKNDFKVTRANQINYSRFKFKNTASFFNGRGQNNFRLKGIKYVCKRNHPKYFHKYKDTTIPMDLFIEFLGYFITEGALVSSCLNRHIYPISFVQKFGGQANKIRKCLRRLTDILKVKLTESIDTKKGAYRWSISDKRLWTYLNKNCGHKAKIKKLPYWILLLSKSQLTILYHAMMLGDGGKNYKSFFSYSKDLANTFNIIACLIGKSTKFSKEWHRGFKNKYNWLYKVILSDEIHKGIRKKQIQSINYKGKVFCLSVPSGLFVTRRNGFVTIQGNTLKARTSIIACANPKYTRFNPTENLSRQLNLPLSILNRFDLIFPVLDLQKKEIDEKIAQVIVDAHTIEFKPKIPYSLIRKYIAYAKNNIKPKLTESSKKEIIKTYLEMRKRKRIMEGVEQEEFQGLKDKSDEKIVQISPRQCEAIIRIAEASAKIRLSNDVLVKDVRKANKLLLFSLGQVAIDIKTLPNGTEERVIDTDILETGKPVSFRNNTQIVLGIIKDLSEKLNNMVPVEDIIKDANEKGISEVKTEEILQYLKWNTKDIYFPKHTIVSLLE